VIHIGGYYDQSGVDRYVLLLFGCDRVKNGVGSPFKLLVVVVVVVCCRYLVDRRKNEIPGGKAGVW